MFATELEHDVANQRAVLQALLDRHGKSFAKQAGFTVKTTPSPLFRLLCLSLLLSARIGSDIAVDAARALAKSGWTTPDKLLQSTWSQRAKVLNRSGYARYDERTSTMLGETAELVADRWHGDLRRLREEADRDPDAERRLLKKSKGIGEVGADIFCREAQTVWGELRPFADRRALRAAKKLGLPDDGRGLARLADSDDLSVVVAALVRVDLAGDHDKVRRAAS